MSEIVERSEALFQAAVAAFEHGQNRLFAVLEALPAPIYVTDADGWVVYFNKACVGFAGRRPATGKDRWCVTWRLYTSEGQELPHAACPMAVALKERRQIRGVTAIAERPDGTRVTFTPFPTPLLDDDGGLAGAVNMLVDLSDPRQADELWRQAEECVQAAELADDPAIRAALAEMALAYQTKASESATRRQ
jgi:PAS domain-containing protein